MTIGKIELAKWLLAIEMGAYIRGRDAGIGYGGYLAGAGLTYRMLPRFEDENERAVVEKCAAYCRSVVSYNWSREAAERAIPNGQLSLPFESPPEPQPTGAIRHS